MNGNSSLKAPRTVWSVWVVLDNGQNNRVGFDEIRMTMNGNPSTVKPIKGASEFGVYPNPSNGEELNLINPDGFKGYVWVLDMRGREVAGFWLSGQDHSALRFQKPLNPGIYLLRLLHQEDPITLKFLVR